MRFIQREQKNNLGTPCAAEDSEGSEEIGFECTLYLSTLFQGQELWGFQASSSCFWKQAFYISGAYQEAGPQDSGCGACALPLEPLMAGLLHCELRTADSALWLGWG